MKPLLTKQALDFTAERNWQRYDTTKNLLMALTKECAELIEIYQWKDTKEFHGSITVNEWDKSTQELADILIYALKLEHAVSIKKHNST